MITSSAPLPEEIRTGNSVPRSKRELCDCWTTCGRLLDELLAGVHHSQKVNGSRCVFGTGGIEMLLRGWQNAFFVQLHRLAAGFDPGDGDLDLFSNAVSLLLIFGTQLVGSKLG